MLATSGNVTAQGTKGQRTAIIPGAVAAKGADWLHLIKGDGSGTLSGREALEIARERFPNLCCTGILPRKAVGEPVDLDDIEIALLFLGQCRRAKTPTVHSFDLRSAIGGQLGAVIAASVAQGFATHSWLGVTTFAPHALIAVNQGDVRRQMTKYRA
jgi:hypothetical protein